MTAFWAWAPSRRRPRRVQKHITARRGALHFLPRNMRGRPVFESPTFGPLEMRILNRNKRVVAAPSAGAALLWWSRRGVVLVANSDLDGEVHVATIFMPYPTSFDEFYFETMIFGGGLDGHAWRCATWAEAEAQHARTVSAAQSVVGLVRVHAHIEGDSVIRREGLWARPTAEPDRFEIVSIPVWAHNLRSHDIVRCEAADDGLTVVEVVRANGWSTYLVQFADGCDAEAILKVGRHLAELNVFYESGPPSCFVLTHSPDVDGCTVKAYLAGLANEGVLELHALD